MDYAHLDPPAMKQTMSCRLRGADKNDQGQHEDGDPRRRLSQVIEHLSSSKIIRKSYSPCFYEVFR
jgi:hypothetical protein